MKTLIQRKITPAIFLSFICVANAASDRQPISNEDAFKIVREEIRINAAKKFLETRKNEAKMKELLARPEDDDFNLDSNPTSPISQNATQESLIDQETFFEEITCDIPLESIDSSALEKLLAVEQKDYAIFLNTIADIYETIQKCPTPFYDLLDLRLKNLIIETLASINPRNYKEFTAFFKTVFKKTKDYGLPLLFTDVFSKVQPSHYDHFLATAKEIFPRDNLSLVDRRNATIVYVSLARIQPKYYSLFKDSVKPLILAMPKGILTPNNKNLELFYKAVVIDSFSKVNPIFYTSPFYADLFLDVFKNFTLNIDFSDINIGIDILAKAKPEFFPYLKTLFNRCKGLMNLAKYSEISTIFENSDKKDYQIELENLCRKHFSYFTGVSKESAESLSNIPLKEEKQTSKVDSDSLDFFWSEHDDSLTLSPSEWADYIQ